MICEAELAKWWSSSCSVGVAESRGESDLLSLSDGDELLPGDDFCFDKAT